MKLLSSFKKELILATRSFYFYVELLFALVILAVLLFAIPEHAHTVRTMYLYADLPEAAYNSIMRELEGEDVDGNVINTELTADGETFKANLIETEDEEIYVLDSEQAVAKLADTQRNTGIAVSLGANGKPQYTYYLQGYESQRLKNLISVMFSIDTADMAERVATQQVTQLSEGIENLNDRENSLPPMIAFNCSLMGMFIMAAYVFLDKKEGVIRAYAVTASSVSKYLLSKIFVILLTSLVSGLVVTVPVMGFKADYLVLIPLLLTSGFLASVAGLLLASFYQDIEKAFGAIFFLLILMIVPGISYYLPGWNPVWVKIIPSYPIIQGFRESITTGGDKIYSLAVTAGALALGTVLFFITNMRFKKTLSV